MTRTAYAEISGYQESDGVEKDVGSKVIYNSNLFIMHLPCMQLRAGLTIFVYIALQMGKFITAQSVQCSHVDVYNVSCTVLSCIMHNELN